MSENGFIKLIRSPKLEDLIKNFPNAFILLTIIALRAKRTGEFSVLSLNPGEALLGDFKEFGLTRQEYRTALEKLLLYGFITTRTTNKGTIATLCNSAIYDINSDFSNQQDNQTATTNKNDKNVVNKETSTYIAPKNNPPPVDENVVVFSFLKNLDLPEVDKKTISKKYAGQEEKLKKILSLKNLDNAYNKTGYILSFLDKDVPKNPPTKEDKLLVNKKFAQDLFLKVKDKIKGKNIFDIANSYCEIGSLGGAFPPPAIGFDQSPSAFQEQVKNALRKIGITQI